LHTSGEQHWALFRQLEPFGKQVLLPHKLMVHMLLQHSDGALHGKPSSVQLLPPQMLF